MSGVGELSAWGKRRARHGGLIVGHDARAADGDRAQCQPAGDDPDRQHAGHDVAHGLFRNDGISLGEYGSAGDQRRLWRMAAVRGEVATGSHAGFLVD